MADLLSLVTQLSQCKTIWTSRESLAFQPKTAASSRSGAPMVDLAVSFRLPSAADQPLPPSFEGGIWAPSGTAMSSKTRQIDGEEVAKVVYMIRLHGHRKGRRVADDVIDLPFRFWCVLTPLVINSLSMLIRFVCCCSSHPFGSEAHPPPLVDLSEPSSSRQPPAQPTRRQGWTTTVVDHRYRERLIAKQSLLVVSVRHHLQSRHLIEGPRRHPTYLSP